MSFRILGLSPEPFQAFFGLSAEALGAKGVQRHRADRTPGFPDRIELRDAEPGETLLLLNYTHQSSDTPYYASHAIFVREGARRPYDKVDEVPEVLRVRLLSLRAFNTSGEMVDADVADGREVEGAIERLFSNPEAAYIQAHYAKPGCYAARIERA